MKSQPILRMRTTAVVAVAALVVALVNVVTAIPADAAVIKAFSPRFQINTTGAIELIGNSVMTCSDARGALNASTCDAARTSAAMSGLTPAPTNNNYFMTNIDRDSDPSTFNSSRSTLTLPAGASVAFAGLYWSGYRIAGADGGAAAPDAAAALSVKFAAGSGSYTALIGQFVGQETTGGKSYQAFADVTSLVALHRSAEYTVANVQAGTGSNQYGGWALVVAYVDPSAPMRNLTVFDGYAKVASGASDKQVDIAVSGFRTPTTGVVNTQVGLVSYEGDRTLTGDGFSIKGNKQNVFTPISNAVNPQNDVANSTVSRDGVLQNDAANSKYPNTLGFDVDRFAQRSDLLTNGETAAVLRVTTSGETWFPGVITFAVDVFAPNVELAKTQTNITSGARGDQPLPGDVLQYTVAVENNGSASNSDTATGVVLTDAIPSGSSYVPGSASIARGPCAPAADSGRNVTVAADELTARLGTGASASLGGSIPPGCAPGPAYTVTFRVQIDADAVSGQVITNQAGALYQGLDTGNNFSSSSNEVRATILAVADLALSKTLATVNPIAGQDLTYLLAVANVGPSAASAPITITDTLPADLFYGGVDSTNSPGWGCAAVGQEITCTYGTSLNAGSSAPDLFLIATPSGLSSGVAQLNTAMVSSPTPDPVPGNNTDTVTLSPQAQVDLAITKLTTSFTAGGTGSYSMIVSNNGPSFYSGPIVVTDTLPNGLTYTGPDPTGWTCTGSATAVCTLTAGELAVGDDAALVLPVAVDPAVVSPITNTATVTTPASDPMTANNTATSESEVSHSSDLSITKALAPATDPVLAGSNTVWRLTLTNSGPSANAGPVVAQDVLPPGMRYVSSVVPTGWLCSANAVAADQSQTVTCTLAGTLASADTADLDLTVSLALSTAGVVLTNSATVSGPDESNSANDYASVTVTPGRGTLQVSKVVLAGNDFRATAATISVNCPANAALDPGHWPRLVTVGVAASSAGSGIIPIAVADTCTVTETASGAPAAPANAGSISPTYNGNAWPVGTTPTLNYAKSANVAASASSGEIVTATATSPCRDKAGTVTASSGTGSCLLRFFTTGNTTVSAVASYAVNGGSEQVGTSTTVSVDPAVADIANQSVEFRNSYFASAPIISTTRKVLLAKVSIPLTVTGRSGTSALPIRGTRTVVMKSSSPGTVSVSVSCTVPAIGVGMKSALQHCTWKFTPLTGQLMVTTLGVRSVVVTVTYTSTPTPSQSSKYTPTTWKRSWKVA